MKEEMKFIVKKITFIFSVFSVFMFGQGSKIDQIITNAEMQRGRHQFDKAYQSIKTAEKLAKQKSTKELPKVYSEMVKYQFSVSNSDSAKIYTEKAMAEAQSINHPEALAYGYYTKSYYYNYLEVRDLAVEFSQKSLDLAQKHNLDLLKPRIYYILYGAHASLDHTAQAYKYAIDAVKSAKKAKNYNLLSNAYSAMSTSMGLLYKENPKPEYMDSILIYLKKSAEVYHKHPNFVSPETYAITNINIADYYYQTKGSVDSIRKYTEIAKQTSLNRDASSSVKANADGLLAQLAIRQGDFNKAEKLLVDAYSDMEKQSSPDYHTLASISEALSQFYQNNNNFEKALFFKKQKEQYNDKIYDQNQQEQTHKLEAQYENKRIKSEIEVVKEREKNRRIQNYLYISLAIMAVFLLILVRRNYANRMKLQAEKELRLQKEKQEAQAQALHKEKQRRLLSIQKIRVERESKLRILLEQEEQARLKEQQELLRLKNDQMHKEALANALQIERKNQLLDEIRESIKAKETDVNIDTILKQEKRMEEALDQSVKEFQEIHPEFFSKLNALSDNKLTPLDLRYCAYIHLKLSTKELAIIFNVEPKSIRMTKYRIKQKLNLDKEKDLEDFLQNIV